MRTFLLACILLICKTAISQTDSAALLRSVEVKLENESASVSSILTDRKFLTLHPHTTFRELIKKYSSDNILTITTDDEPGKKIIVNGVVKNNTGEPVANALIYLYQTDARGWYAADAPHVLMYEGDIRHARLFGYVKTNEKGWFELHTVKPSGYPKSDLPAHIHVQIMAEGYRSYGTEFLFDDDERLKGSIRIDAERNSFLIAKPVKTAPPFQQQFSYTITLQKN